MALRWWMLLVLFLVRLAMGYEFQTIASSAGHLMQAFGLSYAEIGALIGFFLLPGIIFAIPSGLITRALADKTLLIIGAVVMIAGSVVMGFAEDVSALYAGRLLTGIGGTIFNVILTKMVTDWFVGDRLVIALSIMLTAWPGGIALGLLSQGAIADVWGWPWVMHAASLFAVSALMLTIFCYRDAVVPQDAGGPLRFGLPLRQFIHMSVVGFGWAMLNASLILIVSFTPDHLIQNGYSTIEARTVTSLLLWVSLLAVPFGGRVVEYVGHATLVIVVMMGATGLTMLLLARMVSPELTISAMAIVFAIPAGAVMSLTSEAVHVSNRGPGLGIFYTWYYAGMAAAPTLAGWTRDITGDTSTPLILAGLLSFGVVVTTLLLRLLQRTWPISNAKELRMT
jgi:MFS family permease